MNNNLTENHKGNILIVDDTPENLQVLSATLSERGYKVRGVIKGKMAIRAAQSSPPDLILLDIRMPDMNGYEVCEQLKADPQTQAIPVIFISALDEVLDKVRAFSVGGVDYITKPFQVEEVLARVDHQLTIQRLQKQLLAQNQQLQQEIIERKKAEEAAEAASQAKTQFVANMSHELRTPLNAILGFTQVMMRDPSVSSELLEYLRIVNRSGEHLLGLINDVLDLSKIEAGIIGIYDTSFDLYRLLDSLEEMLQIKAETKNLSLRFIVYSDVPPYIKTDEKKLRVCLINLLGNAIKFTESGHVTLRVSVVSQQLSPSPVYHWEEGEDKEEFLLTEGNRGESDHEQITLQFEVEDTGPGIATEEMENLFDAFVQAEAGRKSTEGTGLGLTITRNYVQLMGGDITVCSSLGKGTTFKFNIKIAEADFSEVITNPLRRVTGLESNQEAYRILVVDDNKENRLLLMKLLQPIGFEVREAENGEQAVALWSSWQPQLIWLDTRMPVMDGIEATKQIRARENAQSSITPSSHVPTAIIALTASAFEERRGEILAAGCDDFVCKPFTEQLIFEKIGKYLGVRYIYEDLPQSAITSAGRRYSIRENPDALLLPKLGEMPQTWIAQLSQAANEVNEELVLQLIEQIPEKSANLAEVLKDLLNDFRLDIIVRLTKSVLSSK